VKAVFAKGSGWDVVMEKKPGGGERILKIFLLILIAPFALGFLSVVIISIIKQLGK
jgi:hypothetical protein